MLKIKYDMSSKILTCSDLRDMSVEVFEKTIVMSQRSCYILAMCLIWKSLYILEKSSVFEIDE